MESQSLKQMVSKIFSNKETREEFLKNPDGVMARYSLTEEEKRALLATHARLGLVTDSAQLNEEIGPLMNWF
jgi:hypothetical protein